MCRLRNTLVFAIAVFVVAHAVSSSGAEMAGDRPVWLAVGKPALVQPLTPLVEKRQADGFQTIVSTATIERALSGAPRRPAFLLLVGDEEPDSEEQSWHLAAQRRKLYRWRDGQRSEYASDALWGDLDGDLIPEIPVGRIPARSPGQVKRIVEKILAYESRPPDPRDLQMMTWIGSPSYGQAIDSVATRLGLVMLRTKAPSWICPWIITGNASENFCGVPAEQPNAYNRLLARGGFCSMLMGHGSTQDFYSMKADGTWVVYNAGLAADALADGPPAPPMFIFACDCGNFTQSKSCLAESLLHLPGGPVATIAATTESHPLTNYFSGTCLLQAFGKGERRLGTLWLDAQRRAMTARDFLMEMTLRDVEGKLEDPINVARLRRDQILMYALLGDPATRLRLPRTLNVTVTRTETGWHWSAQRPPGATRIELGFRGTPPMQVELAARPAEPDAAREAFQAANAGFRFRPLAAPPEAGPWEGTVDRAGWLRLVAVGKTELYAAVVRLD